MKNQELKYVFGKIEDNKPVDICFYTDVNYWRCDDFLYEFNYITENYTPSKIRIHINSCGGSCVDGMSVFSKIIDCKIKTECIIDGIAASMASVIWAAGDDAYMKDYALLMIHNPFIDKDGEKTYGQVTEAFTKQLKIIYKKRFGFDDEKIESIMNGKAGNDGTFFTANEAVSAGFIDENHVIATEETNKKQVQNAMNAKDKLQSIKGVMASLCETQYAEKQTIINNKHSQKPQKMNENDVNVFAALFGLTGSEATAEKVTALIKDAQNKSAKYDTLKAEYDTMKEAKDSMEIEFNAAKASVANLTKDLEGAKSELKKYQDAEKMAFEAKVNALVESAINSCKINKDDKESWIEMAKNNFSLAEKALDSIPGRKELGKEIGKEGEKNAQEGIMTEEQKALAKVDEIVGKDFKFSSLG